MLLHDSLCLMIDAEADRVDARDDSCRNLTHYPLRATTPRLPSVFPKYYYYAVMI